MTQAIDVKVTFMAPAGTAGVLRLQHAGGKSKAALLSMERAGSLDGPTGSASLTAADMRQIVDGLMDAIQAIERHDRLSA